MDNCQERIEERYHSTMEDVNELIDKWDNENEEELYDYGLSFDYCESEEEGKPSFFRWQLSWGGPSDEFRFYVDIRDGHVYPYRIEYWFLDWFDGAHTEVIAEEKRTLQRIFEIFTFASEVEPQHLFRDLTY